MKFITIILASTLALTKNRKHKKDHEKKEDSLKMEEE